MKLTRLRIFDLMGLVILAGVNCLPFRAMFRDDLLVSTRFRAYQSTPMASLLLIVLVLAARDIRRDGRARPFLAGFLAFGVVASLVAEIVLQLGLTWAYLETVSRWIDYSVYPPELVDSSLQNPPRRIMVVHALLWLAFLWPQVLVAIAGGLLAKWTGLTICRNRKIGS